MTGRPSWLKIEAPTTANYVGFNGFQLIVEAAARSGLIPTHETAVATTSAARMAASLLWTRSSATGLSKTCVGGEFLCGGGE